MKKFLYYLIVILLVSCTSNTIYKEPKNVIPKDSMINLLTDMYIASSAKYQKNKFLKEEENYMMLVYEKYKIDSLRFDISNTYYTSKIETYNDMLKEVKKRLEAKKAIFDKQIKIKDSIEKSTKLDTLEKKVLEKKTKNIELSPEDELQEIKEPLEELAKE